MALSRPKGSKVYVMDFWFQGQRIRESTGQTSRTLAKEVQVKRQRELREALGGIKRSPAKPQLFGKLLEELISAELNARELALDVTEQDEDEVEHHRIAAKNAKRRYQCSSNHLVPAFGKNFLFDIEPEDLKRYQIERKRNGASNATINSELGLLRKLYRHHGQWGRFAGRHKQLRVKNGIGRALSVDEERVLLDECARSASRLLLPLVVVAIETGARRSTILRLKWWRIDLEQRVIKIGKDKSPSGDHRQVPISARNYAYIKTWATSFPERQPKDYVFPYETGGRRLRTLEADERFEDQYRSDPSRHVESVKTAWNSCRRRAAKRCDRCDYGLLNRTDDGKFVCSSCLTSFSELPTELAKLRFHDLRHTTVTRSVDAGVTLPVIGQIVGWSPSTLAVMVKRYGHSSRKTLRNAIANVSSWDDTRVESLLDEVRQETERRNALQREKFDRRLLLQNTAQTRFGRDQLYEDVWRWPMKSLVPKYGISDVGIAKACKRLDVPHPGRGHWNKVQAGKPVPPRPPLPVGKSTKSRAHAGTSAVTDTGVSPRPRKSPRRNGP